MLRIKELSFFNLIEKREIPSIPRILGSSQDISALLDLMFVTVRFVGLSGNKTMGKSTKYNHKMCDINNCENRI